MNDTNADDRSDVTKLYLGGSIDNSPTDGREWRTELQDDEQYAKANIEFLSPLDEHDPREYEYERNDVVSDDLSLLDEADGILLKYEHGVNCWGTPSEMGYALAVNRLTNDSLPVAVWWDELNEPRGTGYVGYYGFAEEERLSLEDASPWLTDERCAIGVYSTRYTALLSLLSATGHGSNNPFPSEVTVSDTDSTDETRMLFEDAPLEEVLEVFADEGLGAEVWYSEVRDGAREYDRSDINTVLSFLKTLGVVEHRVPPYTMADTEQSRRLLERFVDDCNGSRQCCTAD